MLDLIIKNGECYIDGKLNKTNIGVQNGKISTIAIFPSDVVPNN